MSGKIVNDDTDDDEIRDFLGLAEMVSVTTLVSYRDMEFDGEKMLANAKAKHSLLIGRTIEASPHVAWRTYRREDLAAFEITAEVYVISPDRLRAIYDELHSLRAENVGFREKWR